MDPNNGDGKWADRKRLAVLGGNKRRESKEPRRGNGPSPLPITKREPQQQLTGFSEFVEEPETPILANLRGEVPQAKKYATQLPELRGASKAHAPNNTQLASNDDISTAQAKYTDVRQGKFRQRVESDSPSGRDELIARPKNAVTPPAPALSRPTQDGGAVSQPQSRIVLDGESEDSEAYISGADPDTDANAGPAPTGRRRGRIRVVVRKRPVREGEIGEDCLEVTPPAVRIGAVKQRVDLSEYTENFDYAFDDAFAEHHNNEHVYASCGRTLLDTVFEGGSASCFAYGQTGSGKTHTMIGNENEKGMYVLAAQDLFARVQPDHHRVFVSLYEIYCNSLFDLLNYRSVVVAREDANKRVNICGLTWHEISDPEDLRRLIDKGTIQRRTGSTSVNEFSSRSHAVMTITLRDEANPKFCGSLNIVDLAGSERAADTAAHDKQTRLEGAEINKSLLALKECIRGLDERKRHIPFRGSKLTEVLRDSFVGNSRTVMVATVSPTSDSVEHTLNTLRYAFRVKGLTIAQVEPSKERNAPRVYGGRSRSMEPAQVNYPLLPPLAKEKKKKRSREKRAHRRRDGDEDDEIDRGPTPRRGQPEAAPAVGVGRKEIEQLEVGLKNEIQMLREEFQTMNQHKDRHIESLELRNQRLEKQLERMMRMMSNAETVDVVEEM